MHHEGGRTDASTADLAFHVAREAQLPVILIHPAQKVIEGSNKIFQEAFGWEGSTLIGEPYRGLVTEDDQANLRNLISVLAYGGSQEPLKAHFRVPDRSPKPVTLVGVPNILENPTDRVALLCRPRELIGKPLQPANLDERTKLARIPPRRRAHDERRMNSTSQRLWS